METPIRILVADDHPVVRDGLVAILGTQPDFLVVGEASNGQEIMERAASLQPDLLLLDLEMPGYDSVEALRSVRKINSQIQAILFTAFETDDRILEAVRAGAKGYILKGASREEIFRSIRIVHQGGSLLQPAVFERLLNHVHTYGKDQVDDREQLTGRETEVLELLACGLLNKEIAEMLYISERTVKFHVSAILRKLNAGNRTEAVRIAVETGIIEIRS